MPLLHMHLLLIIQSLQEAPSYSSVAQFSHDKQELNKTKTTILTHTHTYMCKYIYICMYILCFLPLKRQGEYIRIGQSPHEDEQKEIILG